MLSRLSFNTPFVAVCFVCLLLLVYIAIKETSTGQQKGSTNTTYTTNVYTNFKTVKVSITNTNGQEIWYYFWETNRIDILAYYTNQTYITNITGKKFEATIYGSLSGKFGVSCGVIVNDMISVGVGYFDSVFVYGQIRF